MSLADKVTTGTYNVVSLKVKLVLSSLTLALSLPAGDKTQQLNHLRFNTTLQLINGISSGLQKLLKYFIGTAIVGLFSIPSAALSAWATVFPYNLTLYLKDSKLLSLTISASSVASSFE